MDKEELIKEKEAQIEALKQEVRELKDPSSIILRMKNNMIEIFNGPIPLASGEYSQKYQVTLLKGRSVSGYEAWHGLKKMCIELFRGKHQGKRMNISTLTNEEANIAAEFADRVVDIWNEYTMSLYTDCHMEDECLHFKLSDNDVKEE